MRPLPHRVWPTLLCGLFLALNSALALVTPPSPATAANPDADPDADGLTNPEELRRGTNPNNRDTDGDSVNDDLDGWPNTLWLSPAIIPEVRYAVITLRLAGLAADTEVLGLDDSNRVLGYHEAMNDYYEFGYRLSMWSDGQEAPWGEDYDPYSYAYGHSISEAGNDKYVFLKTGQVSGGVSISGGGPALVDKDGQVVSSPLGDYGIYLGHDQDGGIFFYGQGDYGDAGLGAVCRIKPDGSIINIWQKTGVGYSEESGDFSIVDNPVDGGIFAPYTVINDTLSYGVWTRGAEYHAIQDPISYGYDQYGASFAINDNGVLTRFYREFDGVMTAFDAPKAIAENTPNNIPNLFYTWSEWLRKDAADNTWKYEPMMAWDAGTQTQTRVSGVEYMNKRLEIIHGTKITCNGQTQNLANLVFPHWKQVTAQDLNNHGVILANATRQVDLTGQPIPPAQQQPQPVLLVPAILAVDANHDGTITDRDVNQTTQATPYRFWSNDDDDVGAADGDDIPGRPLNKADYNNAVVDSVRDLVDFFPVYLDIKQLLTVLPPSASIKYKLKQADGALNFVYTNQTKTQAFDYQKKILTTGFGPAFTQAAGAATTQQITAAGVDLAEFGPAFLDGIKNNDWGVILVEGRVATTAPLRLVVEKGGVEIAEVAVNIKISPVEEMFRHVNLTGTPKNYDNTNPSLPETPEATRTGTPANWPDTQTNGKYFVFLHGYNVDAQKARGWQAEVFKRMHALGSKARFVCVTWHGATGLDYHRAVFHAFQTGDALAGALSFTGNADVTIAAHSLGNMVVSHAIQSGGLNPARYYIINGATPLEAYDLGDVGPNESANMTEQAWRSYDPRLSMANWHTLFAGTLDNRRSLTWKDLFVSVAQAQGLAHNFYSEEEEVVADADGNTSASVMATLLNQGFNVSFGAWKAQELVKGVDWTTSIVSAFMIRGQAGWALTPIGMSWTIRRGLRDKEGLQLGVDARPRKPWRSPARS